MAVRKLDTRGMECPQPVVLLKKALDEGATEVHVTVDNEAARENVSRMALKCGASFTVVEATDGCFIIEVQAGKPGAAQSSGAGNAAPAEVPTGQAGEAGGAGRALIFISSDRVGRGDDELGAILMRAFCNALPEHGTLPGTVAFMNAGIKLCCADSQVLEALREVEERGVTILVCGTCLDFYELKDGLEVGRVSNMYEIQEALFVASHIVSI